METYWINVCSCTGQTVPVLALLQIDLVLSDARHVVFFRYIYALSRSMNGESCRVHTP